MALTALATLFAAGVGLYTTYETGQATEAAGAEARRLAEIQRQDTLAARAESGALTRQGLKQSSKQFAQTLEFQKSESDKARADRLENQAYERLRGQVGQFMTLMAANKQMQAGVSDAFARRVR